jgi:prepilin-type N-terminal cleavage/methylation domain-containing protein
MKRGVTLVEVMTASMILTVALLVLLSVNSSSSRMTMDSYFEFLAVQIAQEPLEVFRSVGYPQCKNLPKYPISVTTPMTNENGLYPPEVMHFERKIEIEAKPPSYLVSVSVAPKPNSIAQAWLRKGKGVVTMRAFIPAVR